MSTDPVAIYSGQYTEAIALKVETSVRSEGVWARDVTPPRWNAKEVTPHWEVMSEHRENLLAVFVFQLGDMESSCRGQCEFDRLTAAGATVVQEPYRPQENSDMWVATFSDPDDNYFQIASPM